MTVLLRMTDLRRRHGRGDSVVTALDGIDLAVAPSEFVAVMGPSGSGKSTLLHLAGGLDTPTSGTVEVAGVDIGSLSSSGRAALRRKHIGYVFQDFNLLPTLTAGENVALPRELDGVRRSQARRGARAALREVDLTEMIDRFPDQLSGGQQQRVAIELVTHEARHAAWADRVIFLRDGRMVDTAGADDAGSLLLATP